MTTMRQVELRYNPQEIDRKWQERWERDGTYRVRDDDPSPKWYELTMYPYPSGDLHIGHWYAMAPADCHARFRRMQGYNVIHPMGFDAFGLPAENAAIQRGIHPYTWTMGNIENMRGQLRSMGTVYDWEREIICCVPEYYRWNQWFFLKLYEKGLAYRANAPVVWCPSCQTVLANEQVLNGRCERCDTSITRRDLEQWFLRITDYADQLLDFGGLVDWPEKILTMQRNWIGRSVGVEISFDISQLGLDESEISTFTTRIDTIFGVTFMVLAPEHPLVEKLTTPERSSEVAAYVEQARRQTEIERLSAEKEKTGVFLGSYAINRLNGEQVPIFIADYALMGYGTGAVMGVPAHDQRDFEFARKYGLPIRLVIAPSGWAGGDLEEAYLEEGSMVNSGQFDGLPSSQGKEAIADFVEGQGWGRRSVSYRIRDWLISRQRYWGTPIPIVYCEKCGTVPLPEDSLPVLLPEDAEFKPSGESPLVLHQGFVSAACPRCGGAARRETDTMDTFVDSSWYMERFTSPKYDDGPFEPKVLKEWMPVDQYTGGAEHAVMHLLYARFWTKALRDMGLVDFDEPFLRLYNQGIILGEDHEKMSKSRGNVVNPDEYVGSMGADSVRCYLMFLGPWDQGGPWSTSGINGVARWLNRVWEVCQHDPSELDDRPTDEQTVRDTRRDLHQTIKKCYNDLDRFKFNTAIASLMEFSNRLNRVWSEGNVDSATWRDCTEKFLLMLAPFAPHLAEELWERAGHPYSVHNRMFPQWDEELAAEEVITLVVQVNGRLRDKLQVPVDIAEEEAKRLALASAKVQTYISDKQIARTHYVPGRLVNVVVG
ncbi:MAG: leucine--tRNA ligase [Dehalococcoidia bacterium]|nr:leucine--tRNA ligase [Dehalococcoidia bacterium]